MYTKFKECLLNPTKIGKYVDEKLSKTILYFLLLLLIYVLPSIVSLVRVSEMPTNISSVITERFASTQVINYEITDVDGQKMLVSTSDDPRAQYVYLGNFLDFNLVGLDINILALFNTSEEDFNLSSYSFSPNIVDELKDKPVLLVLFPRKILLLRLICLDFLIIMIVFHSLQMNKFKKRLLVMRN